MCDEAFIIPKQALDDDRLSFADLLILAKIYIITEKGEKEQLCKNSFFMQISQRFKKIQIQRSISKLENLGYISSIVKSENGVQGRYIRYIFDKKTKYQNDTLVDDDLNTKVPKRYPAKYHFDTLPKYHFDTSLGINLYRSIDLDLKSRSIETENAKKSECTDVVFCEPIPQKFSNIDGNSLTLITEKKQKSIAKYQNDTSPSIPQNYETVEIMIKEYQDSHRAINPNVDFLDVKNEAIAILDYYLQDGKWRDKNGKIIKQPKRSVTMWLNRAVQNIRTRAPKQQITISENQSTLNEILSSGNNDLNSDDDFLKLLDTK